MGLEVLLQLLLGDIIIIVIVIVIVIVIIMIIVIVITIVVMIIEMITWFLGALRLLDRGDELRDLREGPRIGHANMYPWKHAPFDFENREIMRTL